ncbi:hypothetical protein IAT38_006107 [Cryptococcus sp. DSM 104549]
MKVIVFTATGDQGSSVCKYAVKAGLEVYGLTRNVSSDNAKALSNIGVKLVKGDMADPSTYASSLEGMDAAYINADFWAKYMSNGFDALAAQKGETNESKAAVDACVKAGVKHIVYSTLDAVKEGECPHFESKAAVTAYLKQNNIPHTNLYTCNYFSNLTKFGQFRKTDDGKGWELAVPAPDNTKISSYPVEQTGAWVVKALLNPGQWIGKDMFACSAVISVSEMADVLSKLAGSKVKTLQVPKEVFYSEEHKAACGEELWLAYKLLVEGGMSRDVEESKKVVPDQLDFEAWARQNEDLKEWLKF